MAVVNKPKVTLDGGNRVVLILDGVCQNSDNQKVG